tara:strand:- start:326 stop:634 length:309 start_codon:yes stop_codon:yes gene_type:complete
MEFHNRRLFREEYRPRPFSFAVRREGCAPCGVIEITSGKDNLPIKTMTMQSDASSVPMKFALSAAANVEFGGQRFLHATVLNSFNGQGALQLLFFLSFYVLR